jgi:hypothetical protein
MAMMIVVVSVVMMVTSLRRKTKGNQSYQGDGETDHHVSPGCKHRKKPPACLRLTAKVGRNVVGGSESTEQNKN